jgi:NAD(P)-dependent dehydrogenase (short-subunit alcohol dehydrogenase family)
MKIGSYEGTLIAGKTVIITGASDGIGAATARKLHELGAYLVIVGRSPEKTKRVAEELGVPYYLADFSKFSDVRNLAAQINKDYKRIDVLINNAGGIMGDRRELTVDGNEITTQVNHLSPFLLTHLLMDTLVASRATIINTASAANRMSGTIHLDDLKLDHGYGKWSAYGKSKLMNILFAKELATRFTPEGVHAVSLHPGVVATSFFASSRGVIGLLNRSLSRLLITPAEGADTLIWLATSKPGIDWVSGGYYSKRKLAVADSQARDATLARELWEQSLRIVGQ